MERISGPAPDLNDSRVGKGASQVAQVVNKLPANAGDLRDACLISALGRSPGGGRDNSSILAMDKGAWRARARGVAKSWMWLRRVHAQAEARRRIFCSTQQTATRFDIRKGCTCLFCVILERVFG